jgi:hypothetical protein
MTLKRYKGKAFGEILTEISVGGPDWAQWQAAWSIGIFPPETS